MAYVAELFGNSVHDKSGNTVDLKTHCAGKTVGIYFSAHWCPPCKGFTPVLAEFYTKYSKSKNFEIIFVSADRDENSFKAYYNEMPWLTLAFGEEEKNVWIFFFVF
jgi:nucleoredoxin